MAEWCTIESDPGVFTELIKNIGVKGVQVEEVLDLEMMEYSTEPIYGLIFLFKYIPNSVYNPKVLTNYDEDLYFAKQVIINACATQAILAILLNNEDKIDLGSDLLELKSFTKLMDPYMKGLSISNFDKIREEHNKFSRPEPFIFTGKKEAGEKDDVFHFVAYFHFKNSVYEIDGLREGPILIADDVPNHSWIKAVQKSILNRISIYANNEIKFNLLAVMSDKRGFLERSLEDMSNRRGYLKNLIESIDENKSIERIYSDYDNMSKEDLLKTLNAVEYEIENFKIMLDEENLKFEKYKLENERRQHNYIPLIFELLKIMSEKNALTDIVQEARVHENNKKDKNK